MNHAAAVGIRLAVLDARVAVVRQVVAWLTTGTLKRPVMQVIAQLLTRILGHAFSCWRLLLVVVVGVGVEAWPGVRG